MTENIAKIFDKTKKYNAWEGQALQIGYERRQYLEKITEFLNTRLVKVLVGQRRSGKSYLLRQIMNYLIMNKKVSRDCLCDVYSLFSPFCCVL